MFKPSGRPKGARNKLDAFAYEVALAHARHKISDPPSAEYARTSLWTALEVTLKRDLLWLRLPGRKEAIRATALEVLKKFFAKTSFTQRLPPLCGRIIFGQVFGRGGMSKI